jgi:hypothetical protein
MNNPVPRYPKASSSALAATREWHPGRVTLETSTLHQPPYETLHFVEVDAPTVVVGSPDPGVPNRDLVATQWVPGDGNDRKAIASDTCVYAKDYFLVTPGEDTLERGIVAKVPNRRGDVLRRLVTGERISRRLGCKVRDLLR